MNIAPPPIIDLPTPLAAITFLRNIKVENLMGSKSTSDFILLMNNLFDILNSKSKFGKQYKAPISLQNYANIKIYLQDGIEILKSLKTLQYQLTQSLLSVKSFCKDTTFHISMFLHTDFLKIHLRCFCTH